MIKETEIQTIILHYLRMKGAFVFRVNTLGLMRNGKWCPSPNITKGTADIIGIWNKTPLAVEVKSEKGTLSDDQMRFLNDFGNAGGIAIVARSIKDLERVGIK